MIRNLADNKSLQLMKGDITHVPVDAICNAANAQLAGGLGVDGAIHRAGGPAIMRELDEIRATRGGCPTGSAVATSAGSLPAKWVFHAVGPIYKDGESGEPAELRSAYRACLQLAEETGCEYISFPSISTGVYGYPVREAAVIAIDEVIRHLKDPHRKLQRVVFVLFDDRTCAAYAEALAGAQLSVRYNRSDMQVLQAGQHKLLLLELDPEFLGNIVKQAGFEFTLSETERTVTIDLTAPDRQAPLLLFDAADPGNLGWFSRCQFYVDGTTGLVLQTPIMVANQKDRSGHTLPNALRVQITKEISTTFRLPGKQPVTEQMVYAVLYNLLNALMNVGVGVCGGRIVKPLAGRTETFGSRN